MRCIILCLLVVLTVAGCAYNEAEFIAGRFYLQPRGNCSYRVRRIMAIYDKKGIEYTAKTGYRKSKPHCWLEHQGQIIDPCFANTNRKLYIESDNVTF